jgi:hypothetical protein
MPYQHQNTRTRDAGWTGREDRLPALSAREAFIAAYGQLRDMARATRGPAVLVAAVDSHGREQGSALIEPGHSLTVGRHTECGLRLPDDSIALRHLVAHACLETSRAAPTIHLWDLHTGQRFLTEDGQPSVAVTSQGLLYAAVGQYALLFVPTRESAGLPWPARSEAAWSMFPPRQFTEPHTTASTNGTWRRGRRIGTITLGGVDALELGKKLQVQWLRFPARGTSRDA